MTRSKSPTMDGVEMSTDLVAQQESTKSFTPSATDGGRSSSNEEKGIDAADDGTDSSLAGTADMLATAVTKDRHSAFDPHSEENLEYSASLLPMSPNSMVEAAYRAGVEHRKKRDADRMSRENETTGGEFSAYIDTSNTALGDTSPDFENKRLRLSQADLDSLAAHDVTNMSRSESSARHGLDDQLTAIWNQVAIFRGEDQNGNTARAGKVDAIEMAESSLGETKTLVFAQLDVIIRYGLEAFHQNDELKRECAQMKELCDSRGREVQRLKASEDDLRASLSNLLKAVEASKASARDASRAAQTEARLRGEVSTLLCDRDAALGECAESNRRKILLQEEVRLLKSRVARLTQEKIKVERDSRAALSLARSMDSHAASDVDYYKRKVSDLNDHLQSKTADITELKHQVNEYRRQMERSISQNRLAQIRSEGATSLKSNRSR